MTIEELAGRTEDTSTVVVRVAGVDHPLTLSTAQVAELWSCSAELLQRRVGTGHLPVEPLRLGSRLRWPTLLVAQALGLPAEVTAPPRRGDQPPVAS